MPRPMLGEVKVADGVWFTPSLNFVFEKQVNFSKEFLVGRVLDAEGGVHRLVIYGRYFPGESIPLQVNPPLTREDVLRWLETQ